MRDQFAMRVRVGLSFLHAPGELHAFGGAIPFRDLVRTTKGFLSFRGVGPCFLSY